jgi:hypothetical protein
VVGSIDAEVVSIVAFLPKPLVHLVNRCVAFIQEGVDAER